MTFSIPPGDPNCEVRAECPTDEEIEPLSFDPHVHFRGNDSAYIAYLPDGSQQTLLTVPSYDDNWQESYVLKKPIPSPAVTKIECIAHDDNFVNPNPTAIVTFGERSWDGMRFGYIDFAIPSRKLATAEAP